MCLYLGVLSYYLLGPVYNLHQNYLLSVGSDCIQHKLYIKNNKLAVGTIPLTFLKVSGESRQLSVCLATAQFCQILQGRAGRAQPVMNCTDPVEGKREWTGWDLQEETGGVQRKGAAALSVSSC